MSLAGSPETLLQSLLSHASRSSLSFRANELLSMCLVNRTDRGNDGSSARPFDKGSEGDYCVEARELEYAYPPTPKPREQGKLAQIVPGPRSQLFGVYSISVSIPNIYAFQPFWSLLHIYVYIQSLYISPLSLYIPTFLESTPYLCLYPISMYSNLSGVYSTSMSISNLYIVQPFWSLLHIYA